MIYRLGLLLGCCTVALAEAPPPTNSYLVAFARSDYLGAWADYILDLSAAGEEVIIRSVRISSPNTACSNPIVIMAHERRVSRKTYEDLFAEANPCAIKPKHVRRAMRARRGVDLMEHPVDVTLVATCADETRVLRLPHLPGGRRPSNKKVAKLRDLFWDIRKQVFPADMSFSPDDPDDDFKLQEAAREVVSELQAGKFDHWVEGNNEGWKYVIDRYRGPVRTERLLTPRLLPTDLKFVSFSAPTYPTLPIQARIQGTVRLSLDFGPDGSVIAARTVSGHPLLAPAALEAASSWRADSTNVQSTPAEVEIAFELECEE